MTTEKKKRMPKPAMTAETRHIVDSLLPLLAVEIDSISDNKLLKMAQRPIGDAIGYRTADDEQLKLKTAGIKHFRETVLGIQGMIRGREDMTAWVNESLRPIRAFSPSWQNGLRLFRVDVEGKSLVQDETRWPEMIRGYWVFIVAISFQRNDFFWPEMSNGEFFIGACPRCGKIFEKPRGDSVFCGKYCASEGTRKQYT